MTSNFVIKMNGLLSKSNPSFQCFNPHIHIDGGGKWSLRISCCCPSSQTIRARWPQVRNRLARGHSFVVKCLTKRWQIDKCFSLEVGRSVLSSSMSNFLDERMTLYYTSIGPTKTIFIPLRSYGTLLFDMAEIELFRHFLLPWYDPFFFKLERDWRLLWSFPVALEKLKSTSVKKTNIRTPFFASAAILELEYIFISLNLPHKFTYKNWIPCVLLLAFLSGDNFTTTAAEEENSMTCTGSWFPEETSIIPMLPWHSFLVSKN